MEAPVAVVQVIMQGRGSLVGFVVAVEERQQVGMVIITPIWGVVLAEQHQNQYQQHQVMQVMGW